MRKPRRSKSRDTPTPRASPLPGQGATSDWPNQQPQTQKPQGKPRGRRPKKPPNQDPDQEVQMKQQLIQQQLLQQIEISYRIRQQQQQDQAMTPLQGGLQPPTSETSLAQPQQRVGSYQSFCETTQLVSGPQGSTPQVISLHPSGEPHSQGMTVNDVSTSHSQSYIDSGPPQGHMQDPRQGLPIGISQTHQQRPQQSAISTSQGFPHAKSYSSQGHLQGLQQAPPKQELSEGALQNLPHGAGQSHSLVTDQNQGFLQGEVLGQSQVFPQGSEQVPPAVTNANSFQQMYQTPEHYLKHMQYQGDKKQPFVQYVAHANNPFSDEFMEMQRQENANTKSTKVIKKRYSRKNSTSKMPTYKTPSTPTTPTTPKTPSTPSKIPESQSPMQELKDDVVPAFQESQWQPTLENLTLDNTGGVLDRLREFNPVQSGDRQGEQQQHGNVEQSLSGKKTDALGGIDGPGSPKGSFEQSKDYQSESGNQNESAAKEPGSTTTNIVPSEVVKATAEGIDALQKLECMVADMASKEEACKDIECSLQTGEFELDEENMLRTPPPEAEGDQFAPPSPKGQNPSSQGSSISLECHEHTLTSPLVDSRITSPTSEGFSRVEFGASEHSMQVNNVIRPRADEKIEDTSKTVESKRGRGRHRESAEQEQRKSPSSCSKDLLTANQGDVNACKSGTQDTRAVSEPRSTSFKSSRQSSAVEHLSERPMLTMEDVLSEQPIGTQLLPSQFQGIPLESVQKKVSRSKGPGRPKSSRTEGSVTTVRKKKEEKKRLEKLNEKIVQMDWQTIITTDNTKKEQEQVKKQMIDQRRQEYERKRKEYEEQQRRKRELQKQLRQQKILLKEQQKRKKLINLSGPKLSNPDIPLPTKLEVSSDVGCLITSGSTLSLCEPKLILTHALMHPYGSSLNGHSVLKGTLGKATIDGIIDVYAQYPTPEIEGAVVHPPTPPSSLPPSPHSINGKPMVNGDVSAQRRADLLNMVNRSYSRVQEVSHKRSGYVERPIESVPASMPSPPLSDNINPNAALEALVEPGTSSTAMASGRSSLSNSLSPSPETVQYIASSSPESDAVNKYQTPTFLALNPNSHRETTASPTFPPIFKTIKRENFDQYPDAYRTKSCELESRIMEMRLPHSAAHVHSMQNANEMNYAGRQQSSQDALDADLDNINVTLTLSPTSEQQVSERVASVADLIGCSPPRPSEIVIEPSWKPFISKGCSNTQRHRTFSPGGSKISSSPDDFSKGPVPFSHFSVRRGDEKSSQKKPDGPYCRHCDVLIIGIGVTRQQDGLKNERDSCVSLVANADGEGYKINSVNVQAGDSRGDVFCSEACLKQYFSQVGSRSSSPVRMSLNPQSEGLSSSGTEAIGDESMRGNSVAKGLPVSSLLKVRRSNWTEDEEDLVGVIEMS